MSVSTKNHKPSDLASDANHRMSGDLESLKDVFAQFRKDIMHVLDDAIGVGKSSAAGAVDSAKSHLNDLTDAGGDRIAALEQRIGKHPLAATAIAFGVGMLVAKIMGHRK